MRLLCTSLIVIVIATLVGTGYGFPKATDRAQRWQLTLETGDLRFYRDLETGDGYWLLIYEVTNETGEEHHWIPNFELVTDRGEIIPDGKGVSRKIQLRLLDVFGDQLLLTQSDAGGPLLQGEENAIRGLVIWKAGHEDVREIQVFVGGVSGDTADVVHPITGKKHKLRRVVQLSWFVDGVIDQMLLKPLPKRPVGGGTSVRRLDTETRDSIGGDDVQRKWVFR